MNNLIETVRELKNFQKHYKAKVHLVYNSELNKYFYFLCYPNQLKKEYQLIKTFLK